MSVNDVVTCGHATTYFRATLKNGLTRRVADVCTRSISRMMMGGRGLNRLKFYYRYYSGEYTTQHVRWIRALWRAIGVPENVVKRVTVRNLNNNGVNFYGVDDAEFILLLHGTIRDINELPRTSLTRFALWKQGMDVLDAFNLGGGLSIRESRAGAIRASIVWPTLMLDQASVNAYTIQPMQWGRGKLNDATSIRYISMRHPSKDEVCPFEFNERKLVKGVEKWAYLFKDFGQNPRRTVNIERELN